MSLVDEYTVFFATENLIQAKKLPEKKPLIFPKCLSTRLLKTECFIQIAKGLKTLKVVENFKKSNNEQP